MWRYDTVRNTWREVVKNGAAWPPSSAKFGGVERGQYFDIFLGVTNQGLTNEVWSFSGATETWTLAHAGANETLAGPSARFDPCCTYVPLSDKTYCWGGTDAYGDRDDMWVFNHVTNVWSLMSTTGDAPSPRRLAVCSLLLTNSATAPRIAIHSGWDSSNLVFVNDTAVHVFDVSGNNWATVNQTNPMLLPRDSAKMCASTAGIYLVGGGTEPYYLPKNPDGRMNDLWFLNETSMQFELEHIGALRPSPRIDHNIVVVGTNAWLFFGHNGAEHHTDVWRLNLETLEWHASDSHGSVEGRRGASAASFGATVYFFGGYNGLGELQNTLVSFNTESLVWNTIQAKGTVPPPRAFHAASFSENYLVIIGGRTATSTHSDKVYLFSIQHQSWFNVNATGSEVGGRSHFALLLDPFTISETVKPTAKLNRLRVFGGYRPGLHTRSDRLVLDDVDFDVSDGTTKFHLKVNTLASAIPHGEGVKSYNRAEAAVAGSGNHFFVCGGTIDTSFPMVLNDTCYQYDANLQANLRMATSPDVPVFGVQGIYFGSQFVMFGGQLATEGLKRDVWTDLLQVFTIDGSALCRRNNNGNDTLCVHCSAGTYNPLSSDATPTCTVGEKGSFHWNPFTNASTTNSCPKGLVSTTPAATSTHFCRLCPQNQYAINSSTCANCKGDCPFGSSISNAISTSSAENSTAVRNEQPGDYSSPPVPLWIYLILTFSVCGVGLTLVILLVISGTGADTMVRYYMTPEHEEKLQSCYTRYETPGFGLKEVNLLNTLYDFGIHTIDMETACEEFRLHDFDGSSHIAIDELRMLVCSLFQKQKVPCLKDTDAYANNRPMLDEWKVEAAKAESEGEELPKPAHVYPTACADRLLMTLHKFNFADYDKYTGNHLIGKMGDAIKIQATTGGGLASLAFYLLAVVLVAALVLTFWYSNVIETKSTVPLVTVNESITADMHITIESLGGTHESQQCEGSSLDNQRHCAGSFSTVDVSQDIETQNPAFLHDEEGTRCEATTPDCAITYSCSNCAISALRTIHFDFSLTPDAFARQIRVNVSMSTGIKDAISGDLEHSSVSLVLSPQEGTVFRGFPASTVEVRLVPTKFKRFKNAFEQTPPIIDTGYHAQIVSSTIGNTVDNKDFNQFASVPVRVSLQPSDTVLLIERNPIQSVLQLITSILGAISGLSGALLSIVGKMDNRGVKQREAVRLKALKLKDREQFLQYIDEVEDEERIAEELNSRAVVEDLVDQEVNIQVAQAHLRLIRKCIESDKTGATAATANHKKAAAPFE